MKFHQIPHQVYRRIGTICYSGVTFIEILIKDNKLLWYNLLVISRCLGYKIVKLRHFLQMQIFTHFCIIKPKYELEKTSKFKFNKVTIATHSTIADRQHRVFLTFLTFPLICCFSTARIVSQYVSLSSNQLLIQAICEKTVLEVLNTRVCIVKSIHWDRS